jgi:hypothetical protein
MGSDVLRFRRPPFLGVSRNGDTIAGWFTMETSLKIHDHPFQMDDFRGTFDWKAP